MCIGMVELDQCLIACLQAHRGERRLDLEHSKGLFAGGQSTQRCLARGPAAASAGVPGPPQTLGEHAEIVANASGITRAGPGSQPPARTLPDRVVADFGLDLAIAHPRIVIPSRIVSANVLKAEPIVVTQLQT